MRRLSPAIVLLLAGCVSVGPEFEPPELTANPTWLDAELTEYETSPAELQRWWEQLGDDDLNYLIETALAENNGLKIAGLRVIESNAALAVSTGQRYPQGQFVSGDASISDTGDVRVNQTNLGVGLSWEADFWGRFQSSIDAADAAYFASIAEYDDAMVLLTATVAETYMVIRSTEEQLRLANDSLAIQQRSFEIVDVLYRNGASSELDALQAKTLLLSTEAVIPALEAALRQAQNAMAVLLGGNTAGFETIFTGEGAVPDIPDEIAVGVPAEMLRQRPDVRRAEMLARAQNAVVGVATANLYPSFSLTGFLGATSRDLDTGNATIDDLFSSDSELFSVGANFIWPFFNYGRIKNSVRVEDAALQQALIGYQETALQAARETEDAMAALVGARKQTNILSEGVDVAQRSADLALLRYQEGFADYQRVLDAQQRLFSQQQRYADNRGNVARSYVKLYRSLGGGWQSDAPREFIDEETREQMQERTNWGDVLDDAP